MRNYSKVMPPTVANGRVYVATSGFNVTVYGRRTLHTTATTAHKTFCNAELHTGDVDGDGAQDLICHHRSGLDGFAAGTIEIAYSKSNQALDVGPSRPNWTGNLFWCYESDRRLHVADVDGDGRADLVCHDIYENPGASLYVKFARNGGVFDAPPANWTSPDGWCMSATRSVELLPGDYDGDGRADLLCHELDTGRLHVRLSIPLRRETALHWQPFSASYDRNWSSSFGWCFGAGYQLRVGDVDGDGLDDLLCHRTDGYKWVAYNKLNRASDKPIASFTGTDWEDPLNWCTQAGDQFLLQDVNGDGAADLFCHNTTTGGSWMEQSKAKSHPAWTRAVAPYENPTDWTRTGTACFHAGTPKPVVLLSDLEGDGRSDLICRVPDTSQNTVSYVPLPEMGQ